MTFMSQKYFMLILDSASTVC